MNKNNKKTYLICFKTVDNILPLLSAHQISLSKLKGTSEKIDYQNSFARANNFLLKHL